MTLRFRDLQSFSLKYSISALQEHCVAVTSEGDCHPIMEIAMRWRAELARFWSGRQQEAGPLLSHQESDKDEGVVSGRN